MSELTNTQNSRSDFRWRMLTTVSAVALLVSVCAARDGEAADGDPGSSPFWIELGGQFAQETYTRQPFLPAFVSATPRPPFAVASPAEFQKPPPSSWDGTAKIAYEPTGSSWIFSAGILYGKSNRNNSVNEQTVNPTPGYYHAFFTAYQHSAAESSESHTIVDFQAGKDVGLGMFGFSGTSVLSVGMRYAQFNSRSSAAIISQPTNINPYSPFHRFYGSFAATRKFSGVGPSLVWDASTGLIGNPPSGSFTFDWGVNGAVLFGRQQVHGHHQITDIYNTHSSGYALQHVIYQTSKSPGRSRGVAVPNVGGFAGVSWRYPNAKISVGYRADFFFRAMDGGIDTAKKENVGFYGPFASISIGIGG